MKKNYKVLIYKRTHPGDPRNEGVFGVEDCLGRVRERDFDAVISIGGKSAFPGKFQGMAERIVWVGVNAQKHPAPFLCVMRTRNKVEQPVPYSRLISFDHFAYYWNGSESSGCYTGEEIETKYPNLYSYVFGKGCFTQNPPILTQSSPKCTPALWAEIDDILSKALSAPPSSGRTYPTGLDGLCEDAQNYLLQKGSVWVYPCCSKCKNIGKHSCCPLPSALPVRAPPCGGKLFEPIK